MDKPTLIRLYSVAVYKGVDEGYNQSSK